MEICPRLGHPLTRYARTEGSLLYTRRQDGSADYIIIKLYCYIIILIFLGHLGQHSWDLGLLELRAPGT